MPFLFQRRYGTEDRPLTRSYIRECLLATSQSAQITVAGDPLEWRPHDFRRIFVTDAIRFGLPPHIAAKICGHAALDTTMGVCRDLPGGRDLPSPGLHRPPRNRAAQRGVPRAHCHRVGRVPGPLRTAQGRPGDLRPRLRDPVPA
ncbi:tyrosine-type recombinase/integrase [Streptomyces sp. NPDC046557]|uniref:tyrosine-type recombinase/integrase n=1 Tax=Streptomyces sp. NPDC046557 TaxID=3155372 RepID=UPI0033D81392